ncbi:hypothetical protein EB796_011961 [Bugula neritina]|uniref:Uncharacterized protein n=1 Tax=Bugula neritina TaxID=10212 RepID=A0A7J7JTM6_BUGNE|nr:hypothetical protein EB796_011961 [Bugula neritina]
MRGSPSSTATFVYSYRDIIMPSGSRKSSAKADNTDVELSSCIKEYLEVKKLNETVHTFIEECQRYGFKLPESRVVEGAALNGLLFMWR